MNKSFTESDSKVIEYALKHPTDESAIALKTHDKMFRMNISLHRNIQ